MDGIVYADVLPEDLSALDQFEGKDYRREEVAVLLQEGAPLLVDTYIYIDAAGLADQAWQPQTFDLNAFIAAFCNQ